MHYHRPTLFGRRRLSIFIQHVRLTHKVMDGFGTEVGMGVVEDSIAQEGSRDGVFVTGIWGLSNLWQLSSKRITDMLGRYMSPEFSSSFI